jgi:hypothetical protein
MRKEGEDHVEVVEDFVWRMSEWEEETMVEGQMLDARSATAGASQLDSKLMGTKDLLDGLKSTKEEEGASGRRGWRGRVETKWPKGGCRGGWASCSSNVQAVESRPERIEDAENSRKSEKSAEEGGRGRE